MYIAKTVVLFSVIRPNDYKEPEQEVKMPSEKYVNKEKFGLRLKEGRLLGGPHFMRKNFYDFYDFGTFGTFAI